MKLEAVFWDYPKFLDRNYLEAFLRENNDPEVAQWVMTRFLEHGRVVDALAMFGVREIARRLPSLKLSEQSAKKWKRMVEVYANGARG